MKNKYILLVLCLVVGWVAKAQTFTGPTEVCYNKVYAYTYADDVQYNSVSWTASGGGTITKSVGLKASAKFTSSGSITVKLYYNGSLRSSDTKSVSVYSSGTLNGPTQICTGSAANLSLSGVSGSSFVWQYSTNGSTFYNIGTYGTSITQYPTTTTYYRSYVADCTENLTNVITVSVSPATVAGTMSLTSSSSFCASGTATLSMSGHTGTIQNWEYRYKDGSGSWAIPFTSFSSSSSSTNSMGLSPGSTLVRTYEFRANVKSGSCSTLPTNSVSVNIAPSTNAGTLVIDASQHCDSGYAYLGLNGSVGTPTYQQRTSNNGGSTWTGWSTVSSTAPIAPNGSTSRWYEFRALVQSGSCSQLTSNTVSTEVVPIPAIGTLSVSTASACSGDNVNLTLTSFSAATLSWQYSFKDGAGSWSEFTVFSSTIGLNNSYPLSSGNGIERYYRFQAVAKSIPCSGTEPSNITAQTVVYPTTVGGTLSPPQTDHYSTTNSGTITLAGETGDVQRWEKSNGAGWTNISNTTNSLSYTDLNQVTTYRAVIKSGACNEAYSSTSTVYIYPTPVITSSQEYISYGGEVEFSTTQAFAEYQWYRFEEPLANDTLRNFTARQPGLYKVQVKGSSTASVTYSNVIEVKSVLDGTVAFPYGKKNIKSVTRILKPGVASNIDLYSLEGNEISQTLDYQDGLGRTFQVIGVGQSPGGKDVIQPVGYSEYGLAETTYLPFVGDEKSGALREYAIRGSGGTYNTSDQYNFYQTTSGVAHDTLPHATKVLSSSPLMTLKEQGAPGYDWQPGNGHTIKNDMVLNTASEVHYWKTDGTTDSYYTAKTLAVSLVTDENGNRAKTYTDKMGRTILKKVEADGNVESLSWLETYYIYDEYGRLKYQIPPKAMAVLGTGSSLDANSSSVEELIFEYTYDYLGRVVEKKVPGAAVQYIIYDQLDRVVLTQDANLREDDKWIFVKYDIKGRPVYSGWYVNSGDRATVQGLLDALNYDTTDKWYEEEAVNATYHGYTNQSFPTTNTTLLSVNYYDDYDFDHNGSPDYTYDNTHFTGQAASASTRTRGLPTGSKRRIINSSGVTSDWLIGVTFYDEYDRPIQSQSNNQLYLAGVDKQTTIYDFVKPLKSKSTHNSSASVALNIEDRMEYDHMGRVTKLYRKIGANPEQTIAQYTYNELGQLLNKKLHNTGSEWLQQVDYTYTIRGWLNKINDPSNIGNDYFAMEMLYNESLGALSQTPKHNGNITAIKWKEGFGNDVEEATKAFAYSYYKNYQLQKASYGEGASFALNANAYNEEGLTYDANGNISTLQRKGKSETGTVTTIDNLSYTYASNSLNRLAQVEDGSSNDQGFKNGATSSTEFEYDDSGNVKKDLNKGIDSIAYNELNKVKAVYFTGGKNLKYTYDASGAKLGMEEYNNTTLVKSTKYVGGFVYENDTLRYFASPEGRVVVNDNNYEYQYALSDHQGNTRTVFTSKEETMEFTATFETTVSGLREDTDLYENVDGNNEVSFPSANHTSGGSKVYKMNQTTPSGPGIMLRVYPGDTVEPSVYAYHENSSGYGTSSTSLAAMVTAVAGAFGGANGGGGESQAIYDTFNDALGVLGLGGNQGDDTPAAYLNYIFFDESNGFDTLYQHDDYGWKPIPSSAYFNKTLIQFNSAITIEKPGYIYVYLSYENESNNWVYFDDLKVEYTKSRVVQSNNYYAFGLQTKDSWTRMATQPNQYLYNAGSELNEATSNYEMMFRNYDPAIGRMSGVDPMVNSFASLTPYNYSFNDPVYWNDPSGAVPEKVTENGGNYEDCSCGMYGANYNLATYGGGFGRYGVATGWSDGYVDMILDAKQGDAQALETYGAMHGVSPIGDVNIMNSLKQAGLLDFNSNGDAGFWSDDTSSPLTIKSIFTKFSKHSEKRTQNEPNIYQQISNSFNETESDFTFGDGLRVSAFNMIGNYSVRQIDGKYYFNVSAAGTTTLENEAEISFRGSASLILNGKQVGQSPFVYGDGYNVRYPDGFSNLGGLSIQLPTSGTVMINLQFSYQIDFGSAGLRHSSTMSIPIYIRTIGLPRD